MAIVGSNVIQNGSATDATSYSTATLTPAVDTLYLASFVSRTGISTDPTQPTLSGAGLTWVVVNSVVFDNASSSRRRITVFRAMGSGSAGALTFDEAGQTQTSADWSIDSFTGIDTSGTNGSGAIVQSATNFDATGTATSLTVTLPAFSDSNNSTFGAFGYGNPPNASTAGTGFAKLGDFQEGEAGSRVTTEFQTANDTGVDMSYAAGGEIGGIAVELKIAPATASSTQFLMLMGVGT